MPTHQDPAPLHLSSTERFRTTGMPLFVRRWRRHQAVPLHSHECSELVVIVAGRATHQDGSNRHPIHAGDAFIIHPPVRHGFLEPYSLDLINVVFDREHFANRFAELRALPGFRVLLDLEPRLRRRSGLSPALRLSIADLGRIEALLTSMRQELVQKPCGYLQMATSIFFQCLIVLARAFESEPPPAAHRLLRIAEVLRSIDEHPEAPVTVGGLARSCGLSDSALNRAFAAAVGTTPIDYVIRQRVRRGATLLESSARTITDIAFSVGFEDSNYFARQFRRVMGMTPRSHRRLSQHRPASPPPRADRSGA